MAQSNSMFFVRVLQRMLIMLGLPLVLLLLLVGPFLLFGARGVWIDRLQHLAQIVIFSFLLMR